MWLCEENNFSSVSKTMQCVLFSSQGELGIKIVMNGQKRYKSLSVVLGPTIIFSSIMFEQKKWLQCPYYL